MSRHVVFLIGVSLYLLIGFVGLVWLSEAELPPVYVHAQYGQSILSGQPGRDKLVACVGLSHLHQAGFLVCNGDLVYHPWAYNAPIDDGEFLTEIQEMKRALRDH